jgi:hypothetical protein
MIATPSAATMSSRSAWLGSPRLSAALGGLLVAAVASLLPSLAWGRTAESVDELSVTPAFTAALEDAKSDDADRHRRLMERLTSRGGLDALDSAADYADAARKGLHVDRVVDVLVENSAISARSSFIKLLANPVFVENESRLWGLVVASEKLRPTPAALVRFWDRHSRPQDWSTPLVVGAMIANGGPGALKLFTRKLLDRAHETDARGGWIRSDIPRHRNDEALIMACDKAVRGGLSRPLVRELITVMFDESPPDWLVPDSDVWSPPPLEESSVDALKALVKLAEHIRARGGLSIQQKRLIEARVAKANALLAR